MDEVETSGPSELVFRSFGVEPIATSFNDKERSVEVICSTDCIDSYGEIVEQIWDLARYATNPVVLYAHNSREFPIAKAANTRVEDGKLQAKLLFCNEDENPKGAQTYRLFKGGFLRAVSVGFSPRDMRWEMRDGKEILVLSNNELHEISVTPVPANPEALAKMRARSRAIGNGPRAETAEASPPPENRMDPKELEALKASHAASIKALEDKEAGSRKELATATARVKELETEVDTLKTSEKGLIGKVADLEANAIESEVEALVGTKITPVEREDFVELAKTNRPLFERQIKNRPSMTVTKKKVGEDPDGTNDAGEPTAEGQELDAFAKSEAGKKSAA